jgi:hypothetical protein
MAWRNERADGLEDPTLVNCRLGIGFRTVVARRVLRVSNVCPGRHILHHCLRRPDEYPVQFLAQTRLLANRQHQSGLARMMLSQRRKEKAT